MPDISQNRDYYVVEFGGPHALGSESDRAYYEKSKKQRDYYNNLRSKDISLQAKNNKYKFNDSNFRSKYYDTNLMSSRHRLKIPAADIKDYLDERLRFLMVADSLNNHERKNYESRSTSFIGLYTLGVYTVGKLLQATCSRLSHTYMFYEMPDVSFMKDIINGVYIARSMKDFKREYVLYHRIISLYRNPISLLKISGADQGRTQDMVGSWENL